MFFRSVDTLTASAIHSCNMLIYHVFLFTPMPFQGNDGHCAQDGSKEVPKLMAAVRRRHAHSAVGVAGERRGWGLWAAALGVRRFGAGLTQAQGSRSTGR